MANIAVGNGQAEAQEVCGYGPIWLKREGPWVLVQVECDGEWITVIKEHIDGNFSHCVEPQGIVEALEL